MEQEASARERKRLYNRLYVARCHLARLERRWPYGTVEAIDRARCRVERLESQLGIGEK